MQANGGYMKLLNVSIEKYKCIETTQSFDVQEDITILVGMNESGKTSVLESIAKTNYFQDDSDFKFNTTHDYPRKEKKKVDKSGVTPIAITCTYEITDGLKKQIEEIIGKNILLTDQIKISTKYDNKSTWIDLKTNKESFLTQILKKKNIFSKDLLSRLIKINTEKELNEIITTFKDSMYIDGLTFLKEFFKNSWNWQNDFLGEYIARKFIKPSLPKFLYYDEYYSLPPRINIEKLSRNELDGDEYKTAKALFELADINTSELIASEDFEDFIAELEATEATISDELFKYWKTNENLNITFKIDKITETDRSNNTRIVEHVLDIRVRHKGVSLSLKNRSKGFNWFFSFLVWFKRIQENKDSKYILLLDEPGLNLHASAQRDLLRFLEDLSEDYQIIYTTHSPFMIPELNLNRIRTVLETNNGTVISDTIQEKDPDTLFPLQAALGYDIAQNLFISEKNLLVEGVSDMIYLQIISSILESMGKEHLRNDITIVPTGGLDKVASFISLMRGNDLDIACLLDTPNDAKGKARLEDMVKGKLIHSKKIRFFHEFMEGNTHADIEDLFDKEDYIKLYNSAFPKDKDIAISELKLNIKPIIIQINNYTGKERFNHYLPAKYLTNFLNKNALSDKTLGNFQKVISVVNSLFN